MAVPAQKAAGVSKSYTGQTVYADDKGITPETPEDINNTEKELELRLRMSEALAKNSNYEEENN